MVEGSRGRAVALAQSAIVLAALVVALAPRPAALVERYYAANLYPEVQALATTASNAVPFSVFDVVLVAAAASAGWLWVRALSRSRRARAVLPLLVALRITMTVAAAGYLWFVGIWGLNYARPALDLRLELPEAPATAAEVTTLIDEAVGQTNRLFDRAHAERFLAYDAERDIARALHAVETRLFGRSRPTVPGRPKATALGTYFRLAGVDGLTAPLALETLLNPDLIPAERPFVLAHEWAHLSGLAAEADANFVGWLAATDADADPASRYSGWLFLVMEAAPQVPRDARAAALERLAAGPRRDLDAIAARARLRVDLVQRVGWRVYDRYLKSQGVPEGIASYSRVVNLVVRASRARPRRDPQLPMLMPQ